MGQQWDIEVPSCGQELLDPVMHSAESGAAKAIWVIPGLNSLPDPPGAPGPGEGRDHFLVLRVQLLPPQGTPVNPVSPGWLQYLLGAPLCLHLIVS